MDRKVKFGSVSECVVKYVIVKIFNDNTIKYVTEIEHYPHKYVHWDDDKQAYFFDDRKYAEDVCFGLNVNSYGCFVMEVPEFFNEGDFINRVEKKEGK